MMLIRRAGPKGLKVLHQANFKQFIVYWLTIKLFKKQIARYVHFNKGSPTYREAF